MSREPKSSHGAAASDSSADQAVSWQPSASLENLRQRAAILARIREFFSRRGVLEVETPLLAAATVTELHLHSLSCRLHGRQTVYLQTSPEFAMKRLLAAGSGSIYQICKAFRDHEVGRRHNPEFTMLEWYRPGFDHHALMDEVEELLLELLDCEPAERCTYSELFDLFLELDPHGASIADLRRHANRAGIDVTGLDLDDRDAWLDLLLSHLIEPRLGRGRPTFVYDYPASQAALARLRQGSPTVAERFEVYVEGVELANGFHELADADEQRRRFLDDLKARKALGLSPVPLDERLLAALADGFPDCAGVALGVDRLMMAKLGAATLSDVIAFPCDRA